MIPSVLKKPGLLFLSFVAALFVVIATSAPANAATLQEDSEKYITYRAINGCLVKNDLGNKNPTDVIKGDWWSLPASQDWMGVALLSGDDQNETSCQNGKGDNFIAGSASTLGFNDAGALWCSIQPNAGRDNDGSGANEFEKCTSGSGDFDASGSKSAQGAQFAEGIRNYSTLGADFPFEATGAMKYYIYFETFKEFCDVDRTKDYVERTDKTLADSSEYVVVNEVVLVNGEPDIVPALYKVNVKDNQKHLVNGVWSEPDGDSYNLTCGELAGKTWDFDEAYGLYLKAHPEEAVETGGGGGGSTEPVCSAGALGWVICPLAEGLVTAITGIAELLEGLLVYQPLIGSSQGNAIKAIWNLILVIANLGLVIAILIIVFSQATSVGLSNYGIKKLLPRVFAAAILMNLSFYLCAVAVDLSNILGVSVKAIVEAGMGQLEAVNQGSDAVEYGAGIAQHFTVGVGGLLIAAIAFSTGAIWLLLPILISGLVAIITALLILAARQVLITMLIIIAPLAFLAWILPNTDEWFTKWRKLFTILLLLFPMIMAIFYGSILVSAVILSAGTQSSSGLNNFTIKLLAFLVLIVPLFSLPFIMKAAGGILDRFGVLVNNRNKGLVDRSRKFADERKGRTSYQRGRGIRQNAKQDFRNKRFAERLNLSNKSFEDFKAENGGSLTPTQVAQWTRAQQTKGLAGGTGEIARMTGRGAMKGVASIPGSPGSLTGSARDATLLGGAYAASAASKIPGGDMRRAQTEALNRGAQAQEAKAFAERVSTIQTNYDRGGSAGADTSAGGYLDMQYREAIATNNQEQAAAVISRLSGLGAGGRNRLSSALQANPVTDGKMQDTIVKSVMQDNYGSLVGSRADTAKASGFNATTGVWDTSGALGKVGTGQLATQDEKTLYQNFGDISVAEATKIMSEPNLESTVQNAKARAILSARSTGIAALPATGLIDPSDPALGRWDDLAR